MFLGISLVYAILASGLLSVGLLALIREPPTDNGNDDDSSDDNEGGRI